MYIVFAMKRHIYYHVIIGVLVLIPTSIFALTQRISIDSFGNEWNWTSQAQHMSSNGKYIYFESYADNLVPNDMNWLQDIFMRDITNNKTTRISVDSSWNEANNSVQFWAIIPISSGWEYVVFQSYASTLVPNDMNWLQDIFMRDIVHNRTTRISVDSSWNEANSNSYAISITPNWRYVLFQSYASTLVPNDTNNLPDIFVRDTVMNITRRVTENVFGKGVNSRSYGWYISDNGRYVTFYSSANNLVLNDKNELWDVFVKDIVTWIVTRVSVNDSWNEANGYSESLAINSNGRYVLFYSSADNLVPNDTNKQNDLFVRDMINNTTIRVSVDSNWNESNAYSYGDIISPDGRYVVFHSSADNLVPNDTNGQDDVFVRDIVAGTTSIASVNSSWNIWNGFSKPVAITPDGRYVLFISSSKDLVQADINNSNDGFIRDMINNTTHMITVNSAWWVSNSISYINNRKSISLDGEYVAFSSYSNNLVWNDTNKQLDIFINQWKILLNKQPVIDYPSNEEILNTWNIYIYGSAERGAKIFLTLGWTTYLWMANNSWKWLFEFTWLKTNTYNIEVSQLLKWESQLSAVSKSLFSIEPIKLIDMSNPVRPIIEVLPSASIKIIQIKSTTSNIAIKEAIVQTSSVTIGQKVRIMTIENKVFQTKEKCYTPKSVVDITLGSIKTNKDLLVYQALLKSYDLSIFSNTDDFKPQNWLKRYEAAKIFTNFAKYVLCRKPVSVYNNEYSDIENIDKTLKPYIIQAYEYGIFKGTKKQFRPLDRMSKKEFIASLMRMFMNVNMDIYWLGNDWDMNYVAAFNEYGLDNIIWNNQEITRYDVSKILYKLYYNTTYKWTNNGYVLP